MTLGPDSVASTPGDRALFFEENRVGLEQPQQPPLLYFQNPASTLSDDFIA